MPPWVASAPRLTSLLNGRALDPMMPSCPCRSRVARWRLSNLGVRSASTQVSPTAINLRPNIPPRNQELHDALSALSRTAETYVNISRLQLALKGLAAQDAVMRVAVLGLNSQMSAQRLARLLLADPLSAEEQWERKLETADDGDERAILLKYGDASDAQTPTPLYKALSIPSRVLRSHNLELLVSTLNVNVVHTIAASTESSKESVLVPKLQATSATGVPVPYPVHKTLLFGEGLASAIAFGKFTADSTEDLGDSVKLAVNLPPPSEEITVNEQAGTAVVNVETGAKAIATFRESIKNSVAYERGWYKSGLPDLSNWLVHDIQPSTSIKPALRNLISSVADDVEANIAKEDAARVRALDLLATTQQASASINTHLESWAEKSHTELRDELDEAFSARSWHKLAWWKLFWRVDDVTMISSEMLERRWLISAEKNSIYLAGRMNQAGFPEDAQLLAVNSIPEATNEEAASAAGNQRMTMSTEVRKAKPWYEHIAATRTDLINDTVPQLQALAQRLILQTFSTTSISSTASALLYVAMSSFSLFEASAIGVLGLVFSLRRMQKLWEGARESWQGTVREEGRRTLKSTEDLVRLIIRSKEREKLGLGTEDEGVQQRKTAREAVMKVREALERIEKKNVR